MMWSVAAVAALGGGLAGFLAAILTLAARRLRNRALMTRDEPGTKDVVFPIFYVPLCAAVGLVLGAVLSLFLTRNHAIAVAALAPAGLLVLIAFASAIGRR